MARLNARLALAAASALALLLLAGPVMAQKQILEDRPVTMETLLDRIQIEDFLTRYYYDLSVGKAKELAEYFTEDAVLDVDGMVAKGHAEIAKLYQRPEGAAVAGGDGTTPARQHAADESDHQRGRRHRHRAPHLDRRHERGRRQAAQPVRRGPGVHRAAQGQRQVAHQPPLHQLRQRAAGSLRRHLEAPRAPLRLGDLLAAQRTTNPLSALITFVRCLHESSGRLACSDGPLFHGRRFNLDKELWKSETRDSEQRARRLTPGLDETAHRGPGRREKAGNVGRVIVQSHDIAERETGRTQDGGEILESLPDLFPHVTGVKWPALSIDRRLSGTVERAGRTGDFHRLREAKLVLPRPRIDLSLFGHGTSFLEQLQRRNGHSPTAASTKA